jgi:hypothetical protein
MYYHVNLISAAALIESIQVAPLVPRAKRQYPQPAGILPGLGAGLSGRETNLSFTYFNPLKDSSARADPLYPASPRGSFCPSFMF